MPSSASWIVSTVPVLERNRGLHSKHQNHSILSNLYHSKPMALTPTLKSLIQRLLHPSILNVISTVLNFMLKMTHNWDLLDCKNEAIVTNRSRYLHIANAEKVLWKESHLYCHEEDNYTDATLLIISSSRKPQKKVFKHRKTLIVTLINCEILKSCSQNQQQ